MNRKTYHALGALVGFFQLLQFLFENRNFILIVARMLAISGPVVIDVATSWTFGFFLDGSLFGFKVGHAGQHVRFRELRLAVES